MFVARFGVFLEKEFVSRSVSGRTIHLDEVPDGTVTQEPHDNPEEVREPEEVVE